MIMNDLTENSDEDDVSLAKVQEQCEDLERSWRLYGYAPIVEMCAQQAQFEQRQGDKLEYMQTLPFVNQRLAQWVLADRECSQIGRHRLSPQNFQNIFKKTYDIVHNSAPRYLLQSGGISAMRAMAFQQFEYQTASRFALLRQFYIASQLPRNHKLLTWNSNSSALTGADLVLGSHILAAHVLKNPGKYISALQLQTGIKWFPKEKMISLLHGLAASTSQLRDRFVNDDKKAISVLSAMHSPVFRAKPLFQVSHKQYVTWSPPLLLRSLGNFFLQSIRESGNDQLIAEYGKVFESKYVMSAAMALCKKCIAEATLMTLLQSNEKVVDLALNFDEDIVLVEAKVKEASVGTQSAIEETLIGDRLKGSILKAIEQGMSTASLIRDGRLEALGLSKKANRYLLIISTEQHYMGTGVDIAERTGKARMERLRAQYAPELPIPFENIVLLTADGLDSLVALSERGERDLVSFMKEMRERQLTADPSRRVMVGEEILVLSDQDALPSYLSESKEQWMSNILGTYNRNQSGTDHH